MSSGGCRAGGVGFGWVVKNFILDLGQNQILKICVILFIYLFFLGGGAVWGQPFFGMNVLVGLKQGCILNLVEFACVGVEKKWGAVLVCGVVWFWFTLGK